MRDEIYARIDPERIDMLTRIVEAYDHLGVVSTVDRSRGQVVVRVTADTWAEVMDILHNLPFPIEFLD